jgi:peptidoglycan-associated lipoprotein
LGLQIFRRASILKVTVGGFAPEYAISARVGCMELELQTTLRFRRRKAMRWRFGAIVIAIGAIALGSTGCASKQAGTADDSTGQGAGTGSEFDDGSLGEDSPVSTSTIADLASVYFDYDKSAIRSDAAEALRGNASVVKANADWGQVTIEGNTDERGSEEYNLALGERRAMAVKRYLVDLGVSNSRLRTVSFGEAKPAVPGHDESAYRYNRRSDFSN